MSATTSRNPGRGSRPSAGSTRERILDIALELFTDQGYDKTSIRDIAERLGTTKAALYYHFPRKEDILLELHLRLHALGRGLLDELEALPDDEARVAAWPRLLDRSITEIAENRKLILMHQRNQNAVQVLENHERHQAENDDLEQQFRRLVANQSLPLADRVRIVCSIGAVIGGVLGGSDTFFESPDEVTDAVREVVRDLFPERPPAKRRRAASG